MEKQCKRCKSVELIDDIHDICYECFVELDLEQHDIELKKEYQVMAGNLEEDE